MACLLGLVSAVGMAQHTPFAEPALRPADPRPPAPLFAPAAKPALELPPLPASSQDGMLSSQPSVFIRRVEIEGASAIPESELRALAAEYEQRSVTAEELQQLRHRLTQLYVARGHINSGAVLPDQQVRDGVVRLRVIEGALTEIEVHVSGGGRSLASDYVAERLRIGTGVPLNLADLQERLQILQQDRLIETIHAQLQPGTVPGESRLLVDVTTASPWELGIGVNNHRSPSIGEIRFELFGAHRSVTGRGDTLDARIGLTEGLRDFSFGYALPLNARDTQLLLRASRSDASVVEAPFEPLDIESRASTWSLGLVHPLLRSPARTLSLGMSYERRRSDTSLLGEAFSFSQGVADGHSRVKPLRAFVDWLHRTPNEVFAARLTYTQGSSNAAPQVDGIGPDRRFSAALLQVQWALRLTADGRQLLARADWQETGSSLLALEKLAIGGAFSVRGYRENLLLRDRGRIVSVEYRHPLASAEAAAAPLAAAAFVDYGSGTNHDPPSARPTALSAVGLGLLWNPDKRTQAQLYYAAGLRNAPTPSRELSDRGVHFALSYRLH